MHRSPPTVRSRLVIALAALLAVLLASPAGADTASDRRRRDEVRARRAKVAAELNALEASDRDLEAAVAALDTQVVAADAKAAGARQAAQSAAAALAQIEASLAAKDRHIAQLKQQVVDRAVQSYIRPQTAEADPATSGDVFASARAETLLKAVSGRERDILDQVRAAKEDQAAIRDAAQTARELTAARNKATSEELGKVKRARDDQVRMRNALEARIRSFQAEVDGLAREDAQLAALIQRRSAERASRSGGSAIDTRASAAGLIWPLRGPVTSEYGPRWGRMHEGMDISATSGTPIRAAKAGEVIFVGQQGGYGNITLVDHGGGFVTAYPHQSRFGTTDGAQVAQGQVIGYVGCTGSCTGPHLHFETRVNGAAQNPRRYLP